MHRHIVGIQDVPITVRRTPDGDVHFAVTVIFRRNRNVSGKSPLYRDETSVGAVQPVPDAGRWTIDGDIEFFIVIIIFLNRNVAVEPEVREDKPAVRAADDV